MAEGSLAGVRIFISYAHEDEALKKELDKCMKVLKRSSKIQVWNDRELIAGQEWDAAIMAELAAADVILLLVSVDFNASDFIWDKELASAMQRHEAGSARVVPIILRRCQWSSMPYAKLQALPRNGAPVMDYDNRDDAFTEVAVELEKLVDQLLARTRPTA